MADSYRDILKTEGAKLTANAASSLGHKGGRGDHREELVRAFLAERVGSAFGVAKAEIIDALGHSTGEFDAVIFDQRTAACAVTEAGRKVVRVESVVMTVEIKSILASSDLEDIARSGNKGLLQLHRFYRPSILLHSFGPRMPGWEATVRMFDEGLSGMMHHENIPEVVGAVFAFGGINRDTAGLQLQRFGVDLVCSLNAYTIAKGDLGFTGNPPDLFGWAEGQEALGAFLQLIEEVLEKYLDSRSWVSPNWMRYYHPYPLRPPAPPA